jgi:transcriptional regulator with XRE-family HTH domain
MNAIEQYRNDNGLTQEAFADLVGKTKATVSRWESGVRAPSPETVLEIEAALGIPRQKLRPDLYPVERAA